MYGRSSAAAQPAHAAGRRRALCRLALGLACATTTASAAQAQATPAAPAYGALVGRWVRPDGGYVITIKAVDASGKLDASYANPAPLPFYTAEASRDGSAVKAFFELRAGGYGGSTYTLAYDPANDVLRGVYYQAVARQKYDVVFSRMKQP